MGHKYNLAAGVAFSLISAPISGPARAQDAAPTQPPPPGSLQGFQLDRSRDTSKPKPPEREGPEIDNRPSPLPTPAPAPVIVAPPPVIRTVQPTPASTPQAPARAQVPQRQAEQGRGEKATPAARQAAQETPQPPAESPAPAPPSVTAQPAPVPQAPATGPSALQAAPAETPSGSNLPWIIAALVAAGTAGLVLWRRRKPVERIADGAPVVETGVTPQDDMAPVAASARVAEPVPPDRPGAALAIEFQPQGARHTLIGAAVGYRIILRNEGEVAAENVAIASMIATADARQEQGLASFFAEPVYAPTHAAERIEPGASVQFAGELRLASDAIVPIQVRDRALLIPLVAFSAHYDWDGGNGYSAAAFIVGEESDPPRERMAPFRLDQGPRQYRSVGSRPARTALVG